METLDKALEGAIETSHIQEFAANLAVKETRTIAEMSVGEWVRQGDVYIEKVDSLSGWGETTDRQLAPGTTQGSRHMVVGSVTVFACPNTAQVVRGRMAGPQIDAKEPFRVGHPEHADMELPAGTYQVWYQTDPRTQQRVLD